MPPVQSAHVHLRFDKVVARVLARLDRGIAASVPKGVTVLVTITAPIRLPTKTAAAIEERTRQLLSRSAVKRDALSTVHGNRVRIRVVRHKTPRAPRLMGFVHNPDSNPLPLLKMVTNALT